MIALYILGGLALLIFLFLLLPLRAVIEYSEEGFFLKLRLLFFTLVAVPTAEKGEKKLKLEKKKKKEEKEKRKSGGLVKSLFAIRQDIFRALGKLMKGLKIKRLKVWYLAAAEDAASAALSFGKMSAAMGGVTALLEDLFQVEEKDYRLDVSFEKQAPEVYIEGRLSLQVWRALGILLGLLFAFVRQSPAVPAKKKEATSEDVKGGLENG